MDNNYVLTGEGGWIIMSLLERVGDNYVLTGESGWIILSSRERLGG